MTIETRVLVKLMQVIKDRRENPPEKSYTTSLFHGGVESIGGKIMEEAQEVVDAAEQAENAAGRDHLVHEAADLIYHLLVMLAYSRRRAGRCRKQIGQSIRDFRTGRKSQSRSDELRKTQPLEPHMQNLRIGVPSKGRLAEQAQELLRQAGLSFRRQDRSLFARVREVPIDVTFLRPDDISVLCAEGAIDMGITGSDLVAESNLDVQERLKLGIGNCRLSICVAEDSPIQHAADLRDARIATTFPQVTSSYLARHNAQAHLVRISGSVEIMIALGVADAIVDLVETGSTLAANRLRILDDIGSYETVLIQNSQSHHNELADRVVRRWRAS